MYNYNTNYIYDYNSCDNSYDNSPYDIFSRQRYGLGLDNCRTVHTECANILFLMCCGFSALIYLNRYKILRTLFSKKNNNITPLSTTYKYLFNYNTDDLDSDESDDDVMDENVDINELDSDSNSDSDTEDIVNKSKHIFLTSNYNDVMKNCNNPFYKDNDIKYYLTLEKRVDYIASRFILTEENDDKSKEVIIEDTDNENENENDNENENENENENDNENENENDNENTNDNDNENTNDNDSNNILITVTELQDDKIQALYCSRSIVSEEKNLEKDEDNKLEFKFLESTDINELHVSHNEPNNDKRIELPYTWKINCEDDKYINFVIEEKNIDDFFSNLLGILRCYYSDFQTKYQNLNVIYNENSKSPVLLNQANSSFKDDEYITYNLLNIRDLYAYTNQEIKILNYDKVNLNNKELKEYYSKTIEDLTEETLKTLFKQIY